MAKRPERVKSEESRERQRADRLGEVFDRRMVVGRSKKDSTKDVLQWPSRYDLGAKPMFQAWQQLKGIKLKKGEKIGTDKLAEFLKDAETIVTADRKNRMDRVRKLEAAEEPVIAAKVDEEAAAGEVERLLKEKGIDASKFPNWRTAAMPPTELGIGGSSEYQAFNKARGKREDAEHAYREARKLLNPDGKLDGLIKEDQQMAEQIDALKFISDATEVKKDEKAFAEWKATWQTIVDNGLLKGVDSAHFMELAGEYSPRGFGGPAPEVIPSPPTTAPLSPESRPGPEDGAPRPEDDPTATSGEPATTSDAEADKEKRVAATAKTITEVLAANGTKKEFKEVERWLRESKNFEEAEKIMSRAPGILDLIKNAPNSEEADKYKRQLHEEVLLPYTALMVTPEDEAKHAQERDALVGQIDALVHVIKQRSIAYRAIKWNNERNTIDHLMKEGSELMKLEMRRQELSQKLRDEYGAEWPLPTAVKKMIMETAGVPVTEKMVETMPRRTLIKAVEDAQARVDNAAKLAQHKGNGPTAAPPPPDPKEQKYREKTAAFSKSVGTHKPEGRWGGYEGKKNFTRFLESIEKRNPSPQRASAMFARFVFPERSEGPLSLREQALANAFMIRIEEHKGDVVKGLKSAAQDLPGIMKKHNKGRDVKGDPSLSFTGKDFERGRRIRNYASPFPTF